MSASSPSADASVGRAWSAGSIYFFFFSSRRRHTRCSRDWSSDVCSSDLRIAKYGCRAAASYEAILNDHLVEAIINTTPNSVHRETTLAAAAAGKHVFLDKPIANTISDARAITEASRKAKGGLGLGYQRRRESAFRWVKREIEEGRFGKLVNAEANISRDRLGKIDLSSWRYTAEGMPGGVMLQIGIHYTDVLEYLL